MKNFVKKFLCSPILILFTLASLFFGIPALARKSQINEFSVAVGVGVDVLNEEQGKYEISFLCFTPIADQTFAETYQVFSAKGDSISDVVNEVGLFIGKRLRFAHIKTIVLSEDVLGEDISKLLDFFVRENDVASSTKVVTTNEKAKNFLKLAEKIDNSGTTKISEIVSFNGRDIYAVGTTLGDFFEEYMGPSHSSTLPFFEVVDSETEGLYPVSGKNNHGSSEKSEKRTIANKSGAYVFKNGVGVGLLSAEDTKNLNFLLANSRTGFFTIENVDGDKYDKANISFEIFSMSGKRNVNFINGIPVVEISVGIEVQITEIKTKDGESISQIHFSNLSKLEREFVETQIKGYIANSINLQKKLKVDLANFYSLIYNKDKTKFEKFLSDLDDNEFYLDNIIVKANVKISDR